MKAVLSCITLPIRVVTEFLEDASRGQSQTRPDKFGRPVAEA